MKALTRLALVSFLATLPARPFAFANEPLVSKALQLTEVSLDLALWKLDHDVVDDEGDPDFSADYVPDKLLSYITVFEIKMNDSDTSLDERVAKTIESLKAKAKFFKLHDCPEAYHPPTGWVCYAYEWAITKTTPDGLTIAHVTTRDGRMITKRVRIATPSNAQKEQDALTAFNSIKLKN